MKTKISILLIFTLMPKYSASDGCVEKILREIVNHDASVLTKIVRKENIQDINSVRSVNIKTKEISGEELNALKKGKSINYIVDNNYHIHLVDGDVAIAGDEVIVALPNGSKSGFFVHEYGSLSYDRATHKFQLKPTYGLDLSEDELNLIKSNTDNIILSSGFKHHGTDVVNSMAKSNFFNCVKILEARKTGNNFILDNILAANMVNMTVVMATESLGYLEKELDQKDLPDFIAKRNLETKHGQQVLLADAVNTNFKAATGSTATKLLLMYNVPPMIKVGSQVALSFGMSKVSNKFIYPNIVENYENDESHKKRQNFDQAFSYSKIGLNVWLDKKLFKDLPEYLFSRCKAGIDTSVFVSPRAIRMYDAFSTKFIYLGLRQAIVGQ